MRSLIDPRIPLSARARIVYLCLVVASAIAIGALFFLFEQQKNHLNAAVARATTLAVQVNRSLCLRKNEERQSITSARIYLAQHPHGTRDFPRALIVKAIHDDRAVLATLSDVPCPPVR